MYKQFITDPDVNKFVKASGITGGTEFNAVNYLVIALKNKNLWDNIIALYPFVGGTANTHKWNLKNPLDTNAAFRLSFNGGVTHDDKGVTFNGTTGYADTFVTPSSHLTLNDESIFLYSRTPFLGQTGWVDMGSAVSLTQRDELILRTTLGNAATYINSTSVGAGGVVTTNTNASGFFLSSRISSTDLRLYKDGTQIGTTATLTNNGARSNLSALIGARRVTAGPNGFVARNFSLAGMAIGLTQTESEVFSDIVEQYQQYLNRGLLDINAVNFLNAIHSSAVTITQTMIDATNTLVVDLKSSGLWDKMIAIYPMIGGTSTTHKFNLKNPADTDAAFRLGFVGGWTHTSTGAKPNGTTAYANTFVYPNVSLTSTTLYESFGYYSRTNSGVAGSYTMGTSSTGSVSGAACTMIIRRADGTRSVFSDYPIGTTSYRGAGDTGATRGDVYIMGSQNGSSMKMYSNGSFIVQNTTTASTYTSRNVNNIVLGGLNLNGTAGLFDDKECAFANIGYSLSDSEASELYTIIQKYQTTLGRQV